MTFREALAQVTAEDADERNLKAQYREARDAYDADPGPPWAYEVHRLASLLVDISDDYQGLLDEADDIVAGDHEMGA